MHETNTFKKLKNKPKDNFPEWIIVHHSGGTDANPLADTSSHTAKMMETWHLAKKWEGLGYHYVIHKNGEIWVGRPEHYHGAHTSTFNGVDYNKQSIGICLAGNFDATLPTVEQENALKGLIAPIIAKYNIPAEKVVPHRTFANKTCYGKNLSSEWAMNLMATHGLSKEEIKKQITKLLEFL